MSTVHADEAFWSAGGSAGGRAEGPYARPRRSPAAVAAAYGAAVRDELADRPLERSVLSYFAALVPSGRPVLDVACESGAVAAHLRRLGLDVGGVDPSPSMVALARQENPGGRFEVGSVSSSVSSSVAPSWAHEGSLGGLVSWYATSAVTDAELPAVLAAYRRMLEPGGVALLAFETGAPRRRPEQMADQLGAAGLPVTACLLREAEGAEASPHGFLVARTRATHA